MSIPSEVPDYPYDRTSYDDENRSNSFVQKARDNPMLPIGILSGIGALAYSAFKFRSRGDTKLSIYLIHTRVAAQGAVVGALSLGVLYSMFNQFVLGKEDKQGLRKTRT